MGRTASVAAALALLQYNKQCPGDVHMHTCERNFQQRTVPNKPDLGMAASYFATLHESVVSLVESFRSRHFARPRMYQAL